MSSISQVGNSGVVALSVAGTPPQVHDPTKLREAAQQFEALLLNQILHSARDPDSGWLGSGGDSSSICASDYAEQQLATTIAQNGGLGLSKMITSGLQRDSASPIKPSFRP